MDAIAVKGLDFSYGNTRILKNINFTVPEGRFAVLLGPNGAGKSTLLKLMLGELPLNGQNGRIELLGREIRQFKNWQKVSCVSRTAWHPVRTFRPPWRRSSRQIYTPRLEDSGLQGKRRRSRSDVRWKRLGWKRLQKG